MGETRRLFVAVDPPGPAVAHLARTVEALNVTRAGARVTARELWHVTVAFLGEVPVPRVGEAVAALRAAAGHVPGFVLRIAGGGTFARSRDHVLWAGIDGDLEELRILARLVRVELGRARLPFDDRPYRPHLTLARPGDRVAAEPLARDLETLRGYQGPLWRVDGVHLVCSHGGPRPRHERIATAPLPLPPPPPSPLLPLPSP